MSTSLWPALLAAVVGGGRGVMEDGGSSSTAASSLGPIQSLLALSVLGEHALYWWIAILSFVGLAYATNPSEASFKTHLTDLSFHLHLRRLRAHDPDHLNTQHAAHTLPGDFKRPSLPASSSSSAAAAPASANTASIKDGSASSSSSNGGKNSKVAGKNSNNQTNNIHQSNTNNSTSTRSLQNPFKSGRDTRANGDSGRPHVLSFSNRVSISLKTPAYVRTSYALWSTVRILPASAPKNNTGNSSKSGGSSIGTPGRPLLNGLPPVTRRASTTLTGLNERSNKKSSSSSSSSGASSKSRKGGLVSTVAHGISASLSAPICTPWLEQGGYFVGFLGYWWTVDDGTSFSGAREKTRLGNALLAVEEQDEDDDVSVDQHGSESARHADDLEGGHAFYDHENAATHPSRVEDHPSSNNTTGNGNVKRKHPNKASQSASFRAGQRRSSPTPRQISNKKRGSGSNSIAGGQNNNTPQTVSSGDVTPVTPTSTIPLDRNRLIERNAHHLPTNDDSQLPGLPFHVDCTKDTPSQQTQQQQQYLSEGQVLDVDGQAVTDYIKEREDGISTISHSASALDSAVATVSPALALLQGQLDDLRTSSVATQAKLEAEIEELQARRKDEDAVRTELKVRTKILEESKREAESERLDAEKKLISARSLKKSVEDRVSKSRNELSKLEKKEKEIQEKMIKSREERRSKLENLRLKVRQREALLIKEIESTEKLDKRVLDLEKEIEDRKSDLFQFRREEANAAAIAVTNRMNRAGRGLPGGAPTGGGNGANGANPAGNANAVAAAGAGGSANVGAGAGVAGNHIHAHGTQTTPSATAKRHMHPVHGSHAHRHPSQHPNAAVPIAYPYGYSEEQGKPGNARSPSPPDATVPSTIGTQASSNAGNAEGQTFGSTFMDHRMQSRRAASAAGTLGNQSIGSNQPVSSSMNTSVIGNSASAASALYNRQLDSNDDDRLEILEGDDDHHHERAGRNLAPGSTFAPFGPASPTSPSTIGANSPREQYSLLNGSPSLEHMPYFASDRAMQAQQHHRLRMSTSREDIIATMQSQAGDEGLEHGIAIDMESTPVMSLKHELPVGDDEDSYALSKPRAIGRNSGNGGTGLRRESFDSVGSFTSSNGGPLSPMTPHQASLIPSQLFDMLDDVEMPASPTPHQIANGSIDPHHTFTRGISDALDHNPLETVDGLQQPPRRTSGMYSPWADIDLDAGFDFDKPLSHGSGQQHHFANSAGVSRKPSGREMVGGRQQHVDLLRRRSGSEVHNASSTHEHAHSNNSTIMQGDAIFASYGSIHGQPGQRSNTSSSGGSVSPHLAAQNNGNVNIVNLPAGFGKLSPNDLLFDKARHVLSLNPDAKAFSFNRPLPSSGSTGSLNSIATGGGGGRSNGGLPSNAVGAIGDARYAFDSAGGGTHSLVGGGGDSPILNNGTISTTTGNSTWASPNLTSRGLHNLGYGTTTSSSSNIAGNGNLRESVRSASGPPLSNPSGHTFSPFDDDDLLKGW